MNLITYSSECIAIVSCGLMVSNSLKTKAPKQLTQNINMYKKSRNHKITLNVMSLWMEGRTHYTLCSKFHKGAYCTYSNHRTRRNIHLFAPLFSPSPAFWYKKKLGTDIQTNLHVYNPPQFDLKNKKRRTVPTLNLYVCQIRYCHWWFLRCLTAVFGRSIFFF